MTSFQAGTLYYVQVTLTNNAAGATGTNFTPCIVTVNSSTYSAREATDLKNCNWQDGAGTTIKSRLQGVNNATYSSSTSTQYELYIPTSIAGSGGTLNVYLCFFATGTNKFDGTNTGAAPDLTVNSSTYGSLDNGGTIYPTVYQNFSGSSTPSGWTAVGADATVNNGAIITTTAATNPTYLKSNATYGDVAGQLLYTKAKSNGTSSGAHTELTAGYADWVTTKFTNGFYLDGAPTVGLTDAIRNNGAETFGALTPSTNVFHIWQVSWVATTAIKVAIDYGAYDTVTATTTTAISIGITSNGPNGTVGGTMQWIGIGVAPPSLTMPTSSAGSITPVSTSSNNWY